MTVMACEDKTAPIWAANPFYTTAVMRFISSVMRYQGVGQEPKDVLPQQRQILIGASQSRLGSGRFDYRPSFIGRRLFFDVVRRSIIPSPGAICIGVLSFFRDSASSRRNTRGAEVSGLHQITFEEPRNQ